MNNVQRISHRYGGQARRAWSAADRFLLQMPAAVRFALIAIVWIAISAVIAYRFISVHLPFSFQDEFTYLDYVDKASRGVLLRRNMLIDSYTANELACRGAEHFGYVLGGCGTDVQVTDAPAGGYSTGTIHSPVYFYLTAWIARLMMAFGDVTLIVAARMTGAIYLGIGIAVLWVLLRQLGAGRSVALSAALLVLASPQIWWSNFYITPDSFNLMAGATILLTALHAVRGSWHPIWFVLSSVFFTVVKFQAIFAVGAATIFVLGTWIFDKTRRSQVLRMLPWVGAALGLALAAQSGWQWLRYRLQVAEPANWNYQLDTPSPFILEQALNQSAAFILNLYQGHAAHLYTQAGIHAHVQLASVLLASALVASAIFRVPVTKEQRTFMASMLIALLVVGPMFYAYIAYTSDTAFAISPRYGGALIPALYVGLSAVIDKPWQKRLLLTFSVVVLGFSLYYNVTY